jgi:very-short-patch-repair endonuclease
LFVLPCGWRAARIGGSRGSLHDNEARVIVEFDGFAFHGDRIAFEADRLRDAELQARGFRVIRVTWRQLVDDREGVVDRIGRTTALSATNGR